MLALLGFSMPHCPGFTRQLGRALSFYSFLHIQYGSGRCCSHCLWQLWNSQFFPSGESLITRLGLRQWECFWQGIGSANKCILSPWLSHGVQLTDITRIPLLASEKCHISCLPHNSHLFGKMKHNVQMSAYCRYIQISFLFFFFWGGEGWLLYVSCIFPLPISTCCDIMGLDFCFCQEGKVLSSVLVTLQVHRFTVKTLLIIHVALCSTRHRIGRHHLH